MMRIHMILVYIILLSIFLNILYRLLWNLSLADNLRFLATHKKEHHTVDLPVLAVKTIKSFDIDPHDNCVLCSLLKYTQPPTI